MCPGNMESLHFFRRHYDPCKLAKYIAIQKKANIFAIYILLSRELRGKPKSNKLQTARYMYMQHKQIQATGS